MTKDQKGIQSTTWSHVFCPKGGSLLGNLSNVLQFSIDWNTILNQRGKNGNGSTFHGTAAISLFQGMSFNPLLAHLFAHCAMAHSMTAPHTLPAVEKQLLRVKKDGGNYN